MEGAMEGGRKKERKEEMGIQESEGGRMKWYV